MARLPGTVREPVARTFHSYAFGVLRMAAAAIGDAAPRLLSGAEQDVVVRELLAGDATLGREIWPEGLRPAVATRSFAGQLRDFLLRAVERGLVPESLQQLGTQYRRPSWQSSCSSTSTSHR
jgi:superfamily I DNA/RNA helicase